jgi:hypothetical protein
MSEQSPANDANGIEFREHKDGVCEIFANFVDLGGGRTMSICASVTLHQPLNRRRIDS